MRFEITVIGDNDTQLKVGDDLPDLTALRRSSPLFLKMKDGRT